MNQKECVFSVFKQENNPKQPYYSRWTEEEDKLLYEAVELYGPHKWSMIAKHVVGRTPVQCSTRWLGALNPDVHKGRWSPEEDKALKSSVDSYLKVTSHDSLPWSRIAQSIPNRTGIQCQSRWTEALDPSVVKGRWRKDEDDLLKIGVEMYGCCWIRVAGSIPGRTQRQCRTRWNQIQTKQEKLKRKQKLALEQKTEDKKKRTKKRALIEMKKQETKPYHQDNTAIVIPSHIRSPVSSPLTHDSFSEEDEEVEEIGSLEEEKRRNYFMKQKEMSELNQQQDVFMPYLPFQASDPNLPSFLLFDLIQDNAFYL